MRLSVALPTENDTRDASFNVDVRETLRDLGLHLEVVVVNEPVVADLGGSFTEEVGEALLVVVDAEVAVGLTTRALEATGGHLRSDPHLVQEGMGEVVDGGEAAFPLGVVGAAKGGNSAIKAILTKSFRVLDTLFRMRFPPFFSSIRVSIDTRIVNGQPVIPSFPISGFKRFTSCRMTLFQCLLIMTPVVLDASLMTRSELAVATTNVMKFSHNRTAALARGTARWMIKSVVKLLCCAKVLSHVHAQTTQIFAYGFTPRAFKRRKTRVVHESILDH